MWTNTACGHPAPDEAIVAAVRRRTGEELGIGLRDLRLALPRFRYQATSVGGVMENELCPVFTAVTDDRPRPNPDEVDATEWVTWPVFRDDVLGRRRAVSPWCLTQVQQLTKRASDPAGWAGGDWSALPPAAVPR